MEVKRLVFNIVEECWLGPFLRPRSAQLGYLTFIPWARVGYELAITISYPTSANGIIVLLIFFKLQTSGYYNWILVNFILDIKKRPDTNVTSGKPRENHMTCAPFANLVEWKIWYKYCFRFPSLWLWNLTLDRSNWLLFNFVFFVPWIGAAQRPSFILLLL